MNQETDEFKIGDFVETLWEYVDNHDTTIPRGTRLILSHESPKYKEMWYGTGIVNGVERLLFFSAGNIKKTGS